MEKHPDLYFIGYLIEKGLDWKVANSYGLKAADCLSNKGYSNDAIEILNGLYIKIQISIRRSSGGTVCMGIDDCIHPPAFQLTCPHTPTYKACSKCFVKYFEAAKCGCPNEGISSVIQAALIPNRQMKQEVVIDLDDDEDDDHNPAIDEAQV